MVHDLEIPLRSWAFSELTDLRETGSQTHKRLMCISECQLIPVNSETMDDLPLQCLEGSHFPTGTTMPQAGMSRSLTVPRDHFMSVESEPGEVISWGISHLSQGETWGNPSLSGENTYQVTRLNKPWGARSISSGDSWMSSANPSLDIHADLFYWPILSSGLLIP